MSIRIYQVQQRTTITPLPEGAPIGSMPQIQLSPDLPLVQPQGTTWTAIDIPDGGFIVLVDADDAYHDAIWNSGKAKYLTSKVFDKSNWKDQLDNVKWKDLQGSFKNTVKDKLSEEGIDHSDFHDDHNFRDIFGKIIRRIFDKQRPGYDFTNEKIEWNGERF